jgi:predicted metal-dependent enzyme (double-stranded beta helix superfamily)
MAAALPVYEEEEILLHADDNITIFLVQLSANVLYPPHNHNMAATIALCDGEETATYYRLRNGKPERTVGRTYTAGDLVFLPADAIHAVGNPGEARSLALHIYYGNLPAMRRSLWHPDSGDVLPFTEENYSRFAAPVDADRPFVSPDQEERVTASGEPPSRYRIGVIQ